MRRSLWTIACGVLFAGCAFGDPPPKQSLVPIQAELVANLHVRHVVNGATVFARVTADWRSDDCPLRRGAILEVKVETAIPRVAGTHGSTLALAFTRAECADADLKPFETVLVAVAGVHQAWIRQTTETEIPVTTFVRNAGLPALGNDIGDLIPTHLEFLGITRSFPMRPDLHPGQVIDIRGLKLEVGVGPGGSSVLSTAHRDVALDKYTQFLLVPASVVFGPPSDPHSSAAGDPALRPPVSPPVDNIEICEPPGCTVDLPVSAEELAGSAASSIAIGPLGYAPRMHNFEVEFDGEEALAWLGPRELLLAFNPHELIRRSGIPKERAPVRVIRAFLLDASGHNILRAVDWELADSGRYLWPLDGNRILVHVGNELRVYSSGLSVESRIPLAGALEFVRTSPNGQLTAVATRREQHSPDLHSKLRDISGAEPEEPVDVLILDKEFKTIGSASTSSNLLPPTLLNEGQVKLLAEPKKRYRLAMSTWENKSVTLARFESSCLPQLSSVPPDHLFLVTCNEMGAAVYRVLRADGKLVLRGTSHAQDAGHDAIGDAHNQMFAVKVVRDNQGLESDTEEVRVYRSSDGKQLMAARVNVSPTNRGSFALSPDGLQLAVLVGMQIRLFTVPAQ